MMTKLTTLMLILLGTSAYAEVKDPCQPGEHWTLASEKTPNWLKEFHEFASHTSTPVFAWTRAIQLKRISQVLIQADMEHDFSEYWMARVLYDLKLDPLAWQAFHSVFENSENTDLKKAAYSCLAQIQTRTPDWEAPSLKEASLLPWNEGDSDSLVVPLMGTKSPLVKKLAPQHRALVDAVAALQDKDYPAAIVGFTNFFKYFETHSNKVLERYTDQAHLLYGRALYSVAKFTEAATQFQLVKKTSNEQIEAMSNLAWSYLLQEKYDDAVGVSLQLRAGALKNTFAPEPMMIAAMALNEVCNYPDSIRMVQGFVHDYGPSFEWLSKNQNSKDGYALALQAIKGKATAPVKLATEWLRSPEFLTRQKEINALIEEPKRFVEIEKNAGVEQGKLTTLFLENATRFTQDLKVAKLKLKPGEELSKEFADRYYLVKKEMRLLSQFYRASKVWKSVTKSYAKHLPSYREKLVSRVNTDLSSKNRKLLVLLEKVRDNSDLIEVEIYNAASQDLIWKNAHPNFEKMTKEMKDEKPVQDTAQTWNWGRFLASDIDQSEVWEDELGALKADVSDQCSQKEKFLKLGQLKK